jgi:spore maturation protein A
MINYIWLALLVFALAVGIYKDATGIPTSTTAPDRVVWMGSAAAHVSPGDRNLKEPLAQRVPVDVPLVANDGEAGVASIAIGLAGATDGLTVTAELLDKDNEEFRVQCRLKGQRATFDTTDLTPSLSNLEAEPNAPFTLAGVWVRGATAESPVTVETVTLSFATVHAVSRTEVRAERWMGVATKSSLYWAEEAIKLALGLIGAMMLWLGLMKIAEKAGLVQLLAWLLNPIMQFVFPDVPKGHPALGAIVMNISANMLGLGNSATAMGLKAMKDLQELNRNKDEASNAMVMFLALNTSGLTLIPAGILAYRAAAGAEDLMGFWPMMVAATCVSTFVALVTVKLTERLLIFRSTPPEDETADKEQQP